MKPSNRFVLLSALFSLLSFAVLLSGCPLSSIMFAGAEVDLEVGVTFRGAVGGGGSLTTHYYFTATEGAGDYLLTIDKTRTAVEIVAWSHHNDGNRTRHRLGDVTTDYLMEGIEDGETVDIEVWSVDDYFQTFEITVSKP